MLGIAINLQFLTNDHRPRAISYLLATVLLKRLAASGASAKAVVVAGVLGAVAPDLDMFYFHLVDQRQTHHHKYQ